MPKAQYLEYMAMEELRLKMRTREHKKSMAADGKAKKLPVDRSYYSTEDEDNISDYEIAENELYPKSKKGE